jgi:polyisoprenoid-binding protein YceI
MPRLLLLVIIARLGLGFASAADSSIAGAIDIEKSVITVRVFKAGFFSAFAHDHEISAPIEQGGFNEVNTSVEVKVDARKLRVVDKEISERDRAEIQQTMLGPKVLDSEKFPEIRFRASGPADRPRLGRLTIEGELTLHGQTHPVRVARL